ncbi:putative protein phosphatase 2C 26 [Acorus calamus]|uniref:protein-serine/threonine phosphatase n=1 Tax=Acorus calamus TaxID=4465 RepID=A0AAV9FS64_ACOCL|nr:putative protein phosphatase 2C 26 [Acorus calamus]
MGSGLTRLLLPCGSTETIGRRRRDHRHFESGPLDESLGHSFCYVRSSSYSSSHSVPIKSISGASVSANSSAPKTVLRSSIDYGAAAIGFHSSSASSFSALPLHPAPPHSASLFLSGPIERAALDSSPAVPFSAPLSGDPAAAVSKRRSSSIRRSFSHRPSIVPLLSFSRPSDRRSAAEEEVQWARGKAGEDRVHVAVSEDQGWLFVGIYDGFNGPDAPEFLVGNLYRAVLEALDGVMWEAQEDERPLREFLSEEDDRKNLRRTASMMLSRLRHFSWIFDSEESKSKVKITKESRRRRKEGPVDHEAVLRALSEALEATEEKYLEMTEEVIGRNPELALMGSCVLVVLMRENDVYVMNVGDSRALVARCADEEFDSSKESDLEGVSQKFGEAELVAVQLSTDHSTNIEEEVIRIKKEHPDDKRCIVNGRVKGRLKVTRAFGAGFLKQPKLNNALLEIFRNEYIGTAPYISCSPSLCHHKLGPSDQFLVISSDGLYQHMSNQEVILHVKNFLEKFPDGDPAQSLIEEVLFRAAKEAGMEFHELLDIPQGDRRKYHDDVTVMVVSLEGRIWNSSV